MSEELYSYSQPIVATAVPVPVPAVSDGGFDSTSNIYDAAPSPWVGDDAVQKSSNLFNQLDQMIAAVHSESNALDSMREKLKELDNMKRQISNLTKRLLEADQANITCKGNLIKLQEECTAAKKEKTSIELQQGTLKLDLQRTKEAYNKERQGRLAAQQDIVNYKEHIQRLEKTNHDLQYEVKSLSVHAENNEIIKGDLQKIRAQYREDKQNMQNRIKQLEAQIAQSNVDGLKNEMRGMANRLMDLVNGNNQIGQFNRMPNPMNGIATGMGNMNGSHHQFNQNQNQNQNHSMPAHYHVNMNAPGMNGMGGGIGTTSTNNSFYGGDGDDQNSVISGIHDYSVGPGNPLNSIVEDDNFPQSSNTSLAGRFSVDDPYYNALLMQNQKAAEMDPLLQNQNKDENAGDDTSSQRSRRDGKHRSGRKGGQRRDLTPQNTINSESDNDSLDGEDDTERSVKEKETPQKKQQQQAKKTGKKNNGNHQSKNHRGGNTNSLPRI